MFILSLTYVKPTEEADRFMAPHMDWVNAGYDNGLFLASGRKNPRTGGMILARGDRAEIDAYVATDPFAVEGVAIYEVTEVAVTRTAAGLEGLKD
ncbi:YciI family protein [Agrobacterium sp. RAC06]|uniref:YciI family protein n=1 Tax=Agrobacterium sp. RAC06 TaxID=1842536 RepID=UPI00083DCDAE|nr:YciI family protein [Agrobacterium sp. RAC06]AOG10617.1 YCII-related domain protein [Agrobacterium sp. RAC06]